MLIAADGTGLDLVIVPEPAALPLAALGIGGIAVLARRRARKAKPELRLSISSTF